MNPKSPRKPFRQHLELSIMCALALAAACASTQEPTKPDVPQGPAVEVATAQGIVRGVTERNVHTFKGIPYGAPATGIDRWTPPRPPTQRDRVFDASHYGPACEQTVATIPTWMLTEAGEVALYEMSDLDGFNAEEKSGDCLRLNIWTPELPGPNATVASADRSPAEPASVETMPAESASAESAPTDPTPVETVPAESASAESASAETAPVDPAPAESASASAETAPVDPGPTDPTSVAPAPASPAPARVAAPKGLPVVVNLHGGGLTSGSGAHSVLNGTFLAQKDVVVVTINYRLGSIGFLAGDGMFDGDIMTGNRGFMDTVRALEWIRDNIANFGGDPTNVTLMGQSGGGTNVWSVLASPKSEGLVKRAIIMSGPIYSYPIDDHKKLTADFIDGWGVKPGDKAALENVTEEDAISIATTKLVGSGDTYGELSKTYLPAAGARGTEFMPDDVITAIKKGRFNNIDLLVGSCNDDAKVSIIMVPIPNYFAIDIWNGYIGGLVADTDEGFDAMTEKYIAARPNMSSTRAKEQLQTDALYRIRALKAAAAHSDITKDAALGRTYTYQFNYKSLSFPEDLGAMHGMDLIFSSGNLDRVPKALGSKNGKVNPTTQALSDAMLEAWANFAKTGEPTSAGLPEWPEYESGARKTMVFDTETKVVADPDGDLRKLWDAPQKD